ncbi:MAG: restriction endonuclease subunit S [Thermoplasmata archaeon]
MLNVDGRDDEEFKDTEIGRIPKKWEIVKLGDITTLKNGERPLMINDNNVVPVYGANGVMGYTSKFLVDNDFTLVIGRVGASGEVHIGNGKIWISDNAIYSESYDKSKVYLPLLFYLLKFKNLSKFATKSTHPIITQSFLNSINLPLPPLPEQKAIAKVLSTVDEAIQKCNELIAKTERLKQGLMRELLTKGIGHKEFKDTEIGRIPKEWEVVNVRDVADVKGGKRLPKGHNLLDCPTSHPYLRVVDFMNMGVNINNLKYLSPKTYEHIKRYTISCEDVYISIAGTIGLVGVIPPELDGANLTENAAKLCNLKNIDKLFLAYVLNSIAKPQINALIGKATQPKLALFRIEKIKFPLPPLPEQQKIAEILSTIDKKLELERKRKEKLERIKKGLMNDLLTGKRRIPKEMWEKIGGE